MPWVLWRRDPRTASFLDSNLLRILWACFPLVKLYLSTLFLPSGLTKTDVGESTDIKSSFSIFEMAGRIRKIVFSVLSKILVKNIRPMRRSNASIPIQTWFVFAVGNFGDTSLHQTPSFDFLFLGRAKQPFFRLLYDPKSRTTHEIQCDVHIFGHFNLVFRKFQKISEIMVGKNLFSGF